ncbi:MAG TPA: hypothetical protein VFY04_10040 [Solirubrobacterales bacterium]|nr:hypothetical protein [Solirubrobacterales bacterium]
MPRLVPSRLAALCALALIALCSTAAAAVAKGPLVDLRVVGNGGKVLAEKPAGASPVSVKASPKADCFGPGTGGSGENVAVKAGNALSALFTASKSTASLRPLLVTDAFDFGLGICGVGGSEATKKLSWLIKLDHVASELGGESVKVKTGDEVLWALVPFPYPDELFLQAPRNAQAGKPFGVKVFAYDAKGKRKPAAGVSVTGAGEPTGKDGTTTVVLRGPRRLIARNGEDIPSNRDAVCVGGKCPRG